MHTHTPCMMKEVLALFHPVAPQRFVDGTWGRGGHSRAILDQWPTCHVTAYDRDKQAVDHANMCSQAYESRLKVVHSCFLDMAFPQPVDGILLDVGVSSCQLDDPDRGFSFTHDGPLDMGMGLNTCKAADILLHTEEKDLIRLFLTYGQERFSPAIARAIIKQRETNPITTTKDLAECVAQVIPRKFWGKRHPATRIFQALRIAVNQELEQLALTLPRILQGLKPGGRCVILTFHSLEDRLVKHFIRTHSQPEGVSRHTCMSKAETFVPQVKNLTPKPLRPSDAEKEENPRCSSTKLRAFEKL